MVLIVSDVARITEHALRGKPSFFEMMTLVNTAGQALVNGHQWLWLDTNTITLDLTAAQSYIQIPSSVRVVKSIQVRDSRTHYRVWASPEQILALRQSQTGIPNGFHIGMSHRQVTAGGAPQRVLEIWPTPSANDAAFFVLWYQAQWGSVDGLNDEISIPQWLEPLFLEYCREWALGWVYPESGNPSQRITALKQTEVYLDATRTDGALVGQLGRIEQGAASDMKGYFYLAFGDALINSP